MLLGNLQLSLEMRSSWALSDSYCFCFWQLQNCSDRLDRWFFFFSDRLYVYIGLENFPFCSTCRGNFHDLLSLMTRKTEMRIALCLFSTAGCGDTNLWPLEAADDFCFNLKIGGKSNSHLSIQMTLKGLHRFSGQASFPCGIPERLCLHTVPALWLWPLHACRRMQAFLW